ncbi:MAG: hypothetical protein H0T15_09300, partial [Thermoleophilaceae bacterium]|nr:hypothetical protein [Thermoleophilaceae bacterium]
FQPFAWSTFVAIPVAVLAFVAVAPARERTLRVGAMLYGAGALLAWQIETPMGSNAARIAELFGLPLLLAVLLERKPGELRASRLALGAALLVPFAAWALWPTYRDIRDATDDPSVEPGYYEPVARFLRSRAGSPGRVEVPFTKSHWESAELADEVPLARGWQRQLDTERNPIFYDGLLNPLTYAAWLTENGVRWVALPSAKPDRSSYGERALIERGLPYLRLRWSNSDWRVFEVGLPHPIAVPERGADARVVALEPASFALDVRRPGPTIVRVRFTPYWEPEGACVEPAGAWTRVTPSRAGRVEVVARFTPARLFRRGRRCG